MGYRLSCLLLLWSVGFSTSVLATEEVRIAVASNFLIPLKSLAKTFTSQTGIPVYVSNGASGMLYAKIKRGAPYDLFFSADARRPLLLEQEGLIEKGSRFTYVVGRLVAWSPDEKKISANLLKLNTADPEFRYLAMANPKTAPYGVASVAVLKYYGLYESLTAQKKIALGESVGKAYQYTMTGNAQIGLVAKSYVLNSMHSVKGEVFDIPRNVYPILKQEAVILKGRKTAAVVKFLTFFQTPVVQQQIQAFGYDIPFSQEGEE
ncbi:Molybdenum ABC transporter, substrate-binding protein ModA [hydrothermal vent metagenome]|uniref:Molybdenum ABC transporter, substrate-binding protein ModA n=1 Tax=hydrothermal vent metagenome TaxID=652676 RepID=A0A3B0W8I3_9ZZZZ